MSSSKQMSSSLVSLLSIAFLLQTAVGSVDPLFHTCSGNVTDNSRYSASLDMLLAFLYVKAPPTGFAIHTITPPNYLSDYVQVVNGLALCRGDVSSDECKSCIAKANKDIRNLCPNQKEGVVWYDSCFIKYSDEDFFGHIDNKNQFELVNVNSVKGIDAARFNAKARELLSRLAVEAFHNATVFFAGGEAEIVDDYVSANKTTIYGVVQCTRDLSTSDCKQCLEEAIAMLPSCCDGKQGGRVVGGSCMVDYEIYPFLHS